ncbi:hypothetical protein LTR74_001579 [Friedmanniomyces endolithicus]|nr:hypothetical protein LTR74_001579 [Friedmanniomyces endolithicus]
MNAGTSSILSATSQIPSATAVTNHLPGLPGMSTPSTSSLALGITFLAIILAGLAYFYLNPQDREAAKNRAQQAGQVAQEKSQQAMNMAQEKSQQAMNMAQNKSQQAQEFASQKSQQTQDYASQKSQQTQDFASQKGRQAQDYANQKGQQYGNSSTSDPSFSNRQQQRGAADGIANDQASYDALAASQQNDTYDGANTAARVMAADVTNGGSRRQ